MGRLKRHDTTFTGGKRYVGAPVPYPILVFLLIMLPFRFYCCVFSMAITRPPTLMYSRRELVGT